MPGGSWNCGGTTRPPRSARTRRHVTSAVPPGRCRAVTAGRADAQKPAEALLLARLLFVKGRPTAGVTQLIAEVRTRVAQAVGLDVDYANGPAVLARYGKLMGPATPVESARVE